MMAKVEVNLEHAQELVELVEELTKIKIEGDYHVD
jgi:hypothetical protein